MTKVPVAESISPDVTVKAPEPAAIEQAASAHQPRGLICARPCSPPTMPTCSSRMTRHRLMYIRLAAQLLPAGIGYGGEPYLGVPGRALAGFRRSDCHAANDVAHRRPGRPARRPRARRSATGAYRWARHR